MTPPKNRGNILIVDDTPANLRVLAQLLTAHGYRARPVPSGAYALSSLQSAMPDLILLDIMMPEMDGYELCYLLKTRPETQDIPVIFISALDETFDKVKAFSLGAVDYISKPFQEEEVLARLETHLALRRLQQELAQKNEALAQANAGLEDKVTARTQALAEANQALQAEIEQGKRHQQEKDRLFELAQQQSEQLRLMTQSLLENQQNQRQGLSAGLEAQIQQKIITLRANLAHLPSNLRAYITDTKRILDEMEGYLQQVTTDLGQPQATERDWHDELLLQLSARERQVLRLLADGKSTNAIAEILTVTVGTVQTYIKRIRQKLDIPDLASLTEFAPNAVQDLG